MFDQPPEPRTLSTGQEVAVPLETEAEATAVVVTGDAGTAAEWLPDPLAPLSVAPGRTAVTFLSVDYRRIGDDAMAPYEEVGVLLAVTPADGPVRELGALRRGLAGSAGALGGYVAALPVTTEPARALGVEIWGYPKSVADVRVTDRGGRRRTAVGDERGHLVTFEAPWNPRVEATVRTASYTGGDRHGTGERAEVGTGAGTGDRVGASRQPLELSGRFGARPFGGTYTLGHHPLAERLRDLGLGRSLGTLAFDGRFTIGGGRRADA
ncbi:acetoacetate decarboxylase family protein [Halosimplex halobium]|uniref:acetoacetate decarboxylase family protein n=1 Tax=Halosimplex halobium TaxID=3396618 RepID=UPI003F55E525